MRIDRDEARDMLAACKVELGADFHRLSTEQVEAVLAQADRATYRKPKHASGSRGRYFHDLLQRRAKASEQ